MNIIIVLIITLSIFATTAYILPNSEYSALQDLYEFTHGEHWKWNTPYREYGYPWNFTLHQNPCSIRQPWQGVKCSSGCTIIPCNVLNITLSDHGLKGPLPSTIGNLTHLKHLDLSINALIGSIPASVGDLSNLLYLSFFSNKLSKNLPSELGQLTQLREFINSNNYFTGPIPSSLGNLILLQNLDLCENALTGQIPSTFSKLASLQYLLLCNNALSKTLPPELSNMTALRELMLMNNDITGTIPASFGNFTNLVIFYLHDNKFTQTIPSTIGNLKQLQNLVLLSNLLTGTIPESIGNLISLDVLFLQDNLLTGTIPSSIGNLKKLEYLQVYDNALNGTIPDSFDNFISLVNLDMKANLFTGSLPSLLHLQNLQDMDIESNFLTGAIPVFLNCSMAVMIIRENYLTGSFPIPDLCRCTVLEEVDFTKNFLSGTIPTIPSSHCLQQLNLLLLSQNHFTGSLPTGLIQTPLQVLYLDQNAFSGSIPTTWFAQAIGLTQLCLAKNCFSGTIPPSICTAKHLQTISFDGLHATDSCIDRIFPFYAQSSLYTHQLVEGTIPSCIFQFSHMKQLQLSGNALTGTIPSNFTASLSTLILANNKLTGTIPFTLWNHSKLTYLDVSFNRFKDTFPPSPFPAISLIDTYAEKNITLTYYLQNNRLSGTLPSSLQTVQAMNILEGNQFSCQIDRSDLPHHDPQRLSYECGSDATNVSVVVWTICLGILLSLSLFYACLSLHSEETVLSIHTPIVLCSSYLKQAWLYLTIWRESYHNHILVPSLIPSPSTATIATTTTTTYTHLKSTHQLLHLAFTLCLFITLLGIFLLLPLYTLLNTFYHTYDFSYIWIVSSCYLSGWIPAILLCILYILILVGIGIRCWMVERNLDTFTTTSATATTVTINSENMKMDRKMDVHNCLVIQVVNDSSMLDHTINEEGMPIQGMQQEVKAEEGEGQVFTDEQKVSAAQSTSSSWIRWCSVHSQYILFLALNTFFVCGVNMIYVYIIVVGNYPITIITLASILLSIFKLVWNNLVLGGMLYRMAIQRFFVDVHLQGWHFLCLSLFNNIFIPYFAQAFVSPTCFLYALRLPPSITIYVLQFQCTITNYIYDNVKSPVITCVENTYDTTSYYPTFLYSYQCSSSLVSAFAHVFIYRYLLSGVLLPLLYIGIRYTLAKSPRGGKRHWLVHCLPPLWRLDTTANDLPQVIEYERSIKRSPFGSLLVIEIVTSIAMLLTFGIAFPLLMIIITCSVLVHIQSHIFLIGRWIFYIQTLRRNNEEKRMSHDDEQHSGEIANRLEALLLFVDTEKCKEVRGLFSYGLLLSIGMASMFLSFSLYDILGDVEGGKHAYWIILVTCLTNFSMLLGYMLRKYISPIHR